MNFSFPAMAKSVSIYRKKTSVSNNYPAILALDSNADLTKYDLEDYQLLTTFEIGQWQNNKELKLNFDKT